ncbi:MAG: M23 family metallopeptidase [Clostridia bacterium]|nr:M23 family metallopeptidase [Clostridia bacterium]
MMLNDDNKKSVKKMMAGRALYISLGVCLLAAGAVGFSAVKNMTSPKVTVPQITTEKTTYVNYERHVFTDPTTMPSQTPVEQTVPVTEPVTAAVFDSGNVPLEESTSQEEETVVFSTPLSLSIGRDYSRGVPVFSPTMKDYRTHNGVDFLGMAGDTVRPIARGEVLSVTHDPLWGYSVTVDHGGGVVSKISGLSDKDLPEAGAYVHENAVIGRVGEIPVEAEEAAHIHLEVRVNGKLTDPLELMGLDGAEGE